MWSNAETWAKRSPPKQQLREEIWSSLDETGIAVGPAKGNIPNFAGADMAAYHLSRTPEWQAARTVKCNPDPPQIPIRLRALYAGKVLYVPVPALTRAFPYLRLDPQKLIEKGVSFELAATAEGYMIHGERIEFDEVEPLDFSILGSVAVSRAGGRTGKGAGFADLETGIFRELGKIGPDTPMVTLVHSSQLVAAERVPMMAHDSPLTMIATEAELIRVPPSDIVPAGVDWDMIQPDQFRDIPFLATLRDRLLARSSGEAG
ncbi:5-formyltetrahydrofolate cyclo-ligase [Citreicella sp. C3M06]|uniref:5-formyltetrahydrofolate cyclo-ligase n=1 Tax=Citreicella sp. C3M06 TaxID=2841564 RepID=UPI001C0A3DCA|nr:5-formyltetrahydrofolate cyclo-ligase [Citreicella sp. C3M06]MBU2959344.1 5-formyltetrahydrofolate cyclo-ligase [Citreicella sp. C3M06]